MTKRSIIATFMALLMALLTPLMVFAAEAPAYAENDAVIEELQEDDVVIEEISTTEVNREEDVDGTLQGFRYFTDSYNGLTLTGDDGKATITTNQGSRDLTDTLVVGNGFIQRNDPYTIYLIFVNGSIYWYNVKYQGLNGKIQKLGVKVNSFEYDGTSNGFVTETGTVYFLTDAEVRSRLGISDEGKDDSSSSGKDSGSSSGKDSGSSSSKDDGSSSSKDDGSSSGKDSGSSSGKDSGSSSSKDDGSSSSKDDGSSSGKDSGSSSGKDDGSSSSKDSGSSSGKDDGSSSSKDDENTSGITVIRVVPAYGFVDVDALVNGKTVTYRLMTGEYGEIQDSGITADGLVYILFKSGKLVLWHPSMLKDLNQTTVQAGDLYTVAENCAGIRIVDGVVEFYDTTGAKIVIPSLSQIKVIPASSTANLLMGDYIVDNSMISGGGYRSWTLLTRVENKYYVVKHAKANVDLKFDWISNKRIQFNGKRYKTTKASWSAGGDLFMKVGKRKVYVVRIVQKKDGSYRNKKMRFARRAKDIYINPVTNLAEYVILRNGDKVDCVTFKKIN